MFNFGENNLMWIVLLLVLVNNTDILGRFMGDDNMLLLCVLFFLFINNGGLSMLEHK